MQPNPNLNRPADKVVTRSQSIVSKDLFLIGSFRVRMWHFLLAVVFVVGFASALFWAADQKKYDLSHAAGVVGADGKTFDQRKAEWLARDGARTDGGYDYWNWSYVGARNYVLAWLEKNNHQTCRQNLSTVFNSSIAQCSTSYYDGHVTCQDWVNKIERIDDTPSDTTDPFQYYDLDCVSGNLQNMNRSANWVASGSHAPLTLARIFYQYGNLLNTTDNTAIKNEIKNNALSEYSFGWHPNHFGDGDMQPQLSVIRFLYALGDKSGQVMYCDAPSLQCQSFTYNGTTYTPGVSYSAFALSRDSLYTYFNNIVQRSRSEQDSYTYSMAAVESLRLLYDFSDRTGDPDGVEMKKRTKMILDVIMADSVLDFSAGQHGGATGRTYRGNLIAGKDTMSWFYDWGLAKDINDSAAFASFYRVSDAVVLLGNLTGDSYWHEDKEGGKHAFVTANYNLGGEIKTNNWILKLLARNNDNSSGGAPFSIWINDVPGDMQTGNPPQGACNDGECYMTRGKGLYQKKNVALINVSNPILHVSYGINNQFDAGTLVPYAAKVCRNSQWLCKSVNDCNTSDSGDVCLDGPPNTTDGLGEPFPNDFRLPNATGWNFLKEGKSMVAIYMNPSSNWHALEVATEGVEYPDFAAFQAAPRSFSSGTLFTSGTGIRIDSNDPSTYVSGSQPRLAATDNMGNQIVTWLNNVMTVNKGGYSCVYNFVNWQYSGNGCGSVSGGNQPPVASASVNPTSGVAPLTVQFTGSGTDTDGTIAGYSWNFGDGTANSAVQNPSHTYQTAGTYTAALTVTDNAGATGSKSLIITVTPQTTNFLLTLTKSGTGSGTITSSPTGINCGTTCSASFASSTSVMLTATPDTGSTFAGWSGACTGTGACSVTMNQDQSVTATFNTAGQGSCVLQDNFVSGTLNTSLWQKSTNAESNSTVVNQELQIISGANEGASVSSKSKYPANNKTFAVKVAQPNNDGDIAIATDYTLSSPNGSSGGSTSYYRFYTYRNQSSGPFQLWVESKKGGVVWNADKSANFTSITSGPVWLRMRMDSGNTIHFEASLNNTQWADIYSEPFGLDVPLSSGTYYYALEAWKTDSRGVLIVDDVSICDTSAPPANVLPDNPSNLSQRPNPGDPAMAEGTTIADTMPSFSFTISDPDQGQVIGYQFQVARDVNFMDLVRDFTWAGSATNPNNVTFDILPANALSDGPYWWRVKGLDAAGGSSAWVYFGNQAAADFTVSVPQNFTLTLTKSGTGSGTITSSPTGINCGTTCSASFASSTSVTLTATPDTGSTFAGWSGACTGTGTCSVVMSQDRGVDAAFSLSDTTSPIISNVSSNTITSTGATIVWTTDEASDSQVEYGLTTSYGSSSPLNSSLVTNHSVSLTGLAASTLYHYRVKSKDAVGNLAVSADYTFTTAALARVITLVGSSSAGGTSVTIPAHLAGDLMLVFAYRDGSTTAPSAPSGWTTINSSGGGSSNSSRLAYKIATSNSDTSGTWSGATELVVVVYRNQNPTSPIGAKGSKVGSSSTVNYPALTLQNASGSSWVVGFAGHRNVTATVQNPPTGMTYRTGVSKTGKVAGHDTNGVVSSWTSKSVSVGVSSGWMSRVVEIKP